MKLLFNIILTLSLGCILSACKQALHTTKQQPNVIILYADDMGYGDLNIQNSNSKIPTPNLDKLAREGMRFTDGHSSSGICTPSRYALLTGRYHWRDFHNIVGPLGPSVFKEDQFTIAQMFKDQGYATACIGKWHLGWDWEAIKKADWQNKEIRVPSPEAYDWEKPIPGGPLDRGFDYYFGDGTINFPPYVFMENDKVLEIPTETMSTPKGMALEGHWEARPGPAAKDWDFFKVLPTLTNKAVKYITERKDQEKPFFLYLPFPSPHAPIIPNEEFRGKSKAGPYGDFVFQTDWCAGQMLEALDAIGQTDNTIVIFSSDNGPERYAYDRIQNYEHYSSGELRGLKRDIYEGGHHVPFMVRWPNKIEAGVVNDEVIHQVDILKTLASIIGVELPADLAHDSHDFSNVWLGEPYQEGIRKSTVQNTREGSYAIRMGDWLLVNDSNGYISKPPSWSKEHFGYQKSNSKVELFNLKEDIGQKNNLSEQQPNRVQQLQKELVRVRSKEFSKYQ